MCKPEGGDGVDAVCCEDDRAAVAVTTVAGVGDVGHLAAATAAAPGVAVSHVEPLVVLLSLKLTRPRVSCTDVS